LTEDSVIRRLSFTLGLIGVLAAVGAVPAADA
jgi:hypothetical protein